MIISVPASWNFFHSSLSWRTTLMFSMFWRKSHSYNQNYSDHPRKCKIVAYKHQMEQFINQPKAYYFTVHPEDARLPSVRTWLGSVELGTVGAVDRPSRDWSGSRSVSPPVWSRLTCSSVTVEAFSWSIAAGLEEYPAVRFISEQQWKQRATATVGQTWHRTFSRCNVASCHILYNIQFIKYTPIYIFYYCETALALNQWCQELY